MVGGGELEECQKEKWCSRHRLPDFKTHDKAPNCRKWQEITVN
jgi:hypothetical protein